MNSFIHKPGGRNSHSTGIFRNAIGYIKISVLGSIASIVFLNYTSSSSQQMENPQDDRMIVSAVADTYFTQVDSSEFADYKHEAELKLKENDLLIAELKDRLISHQEDHSLGYEQKLDSLDVMNKLLRNTINNYTSESRVKWESFKVHFTGELDAIGRNINLLDERI